MLRVGHGGIDAMEARLSEMAIANKERDLDVVRDGLARWLRADRPAATDLRVAPLTRPAAGLSSETLFVDVVSTEGGIERHESLVARLPPAGEGLFPAYDLSLQARIQERLAPTAIPVASPVVFEADESWLGAPFLVMPRVPGRVLVSYPSFLQTGWLHDATPAEQAQLHAGFLAAVADIHRIDWEPLRSEFAERGGRVGLAAELDWWTDYLAWASDGAPLPVLEDAMAWCRANGPAAEPPPSLLWGDVQLVNVVFDETSLRPAAVLDWEMTSIGPAETDLGWFLALHRMTVDASDADLPGFPEREAVVASYERRLGRETVALGWFETFAVVRSGAIMVRVARLLAAMGVDDSWLTKGNPQLELLRRLR